jgi:hypothetical protein
MRIIPTEYSSCDTLRDAYADGWNAGHGIACHNVPELGAKLWVESLGRVVVDAENIREVHESLCFDAESNGRSYSPFEHTAHRFNELGDGGWFIMPYGEDMRGPFDTQAEAEAEADGDDVAELPSSEQAWEAYEAGVCDAIHADLATYTDEHYGIESAEA